MIYFDYAATTPVDNRVIHIIAKHLGTDGVFANPSSSIHALGLEARACVEQARSQVAELVRADNHKIHWTSGATESNNIAIKGAMKNGGHMIIHAFEHPAVLETSLNLDNPRCEVTVLNPNRDGTVDIELITSNIKPNTKLISVMHVNNELGVIQDISKIGKLCRSRNIIFHVDAAQSVGKTTIDVNKQKVDLLSMTAHKIYGPKGVGALYVNDTKLLNEFKLLHGGNQEGGVRAGTLATHQIVAMGASFELAYQEMESECLRLLKMRKQLIEGLDNIQGLWINGNQDQCIPGILSIGIEGLSGEDIMLEMPDVAISLGSACGSGESKPSHVLKSIGLTDEQADSCLRISFGRFTTKTEIDQLIHSLQHATSQLRK